MKKLARTLATRIRKEAPTLTYGASKDLFKEVRRILNLAPPRRSGKGTVKRMSRAELERFLQTAFDQDAKTGIMMQALYETGARVSEFVAFQVEDLYADERKIVVQDGKGSKRREIPLTDHLTNQLQLYIELANQKEGRLFRSQNSPWYSVRRIQQIVAGVAKSAGIAMNVTPHTLRHTRATLLAEAGMPKDHLQVFLGHDKPETTQIYTHTAALEVGKSFREASNKINP